MMAGPIFIVQLLVLLFVFYQDLKYRAVNWLAFVVLFVLGIYLSVDTVGAQDTLWNGLLNAGILSIQLLLVFLFYFLKSGKQVRIINNKLGLGDILMLIALVFSFSPVYYIVFVLASLVISLVVTLVQRNHQTIPLAGYLGLFYFIFLLLNHFVIRLNPYIFQPVL